jgi:TPP-dependent pyruvate/acetoin dehydrogenase alpha subunit
MSTAKRSTSRTRRKTAAKRSRAPRTKGKAGTNGGRGSGEYRIAAPKGLSLEKEGFLELYRYMKLNRRFEERLSILYRRGEIVGGLYGSLGQEAISVGTAYALEDGDVLGPMIRNLGTYLVRGISVRDWYAQYMARAIGPTKGKDGNAHFGDLKRGLIAPISVLGELIPVVAGAALTFKMRGQKNIGITYIGDGGTSTTGFHEGLNFAAVHKVPMILVCEHNYYAYSTHVSKQFPTENIADKAPAYGVYGEIVDGNNVLACYDAAQRARKRCVEGGGPVLLECKTFRRKGHAEHDDAGYVDKALRAEWEKKDPFEAYTRFLTREKVARQADLNDIDAEIEAELERCEEEVLKSPFPDPEIATENVYHSANDGGVS